MDVIVFISWTELLCTRCARELVDEIYCILHIQWRVYDLCTQSQSFVLTFRQNEPCSPWCIYQFCPAESTNTPVNSSSLCSYAAAIEHTASVHCNLLTVCSMSPSAAQTFLSIHPIALLVLDSNFFFFFTSQTIVLSDVQQQSGFGPETFKESSLVESNMSSCKRVHHSSKYCAEFLAGGC